MSIEEIITGLEVTAKMFDSIRRHQAETGKSGTADILRAAIDLLRTHPDAQPNEPLRWRSCKKEKPTEKGRYEVVCRNGDIPPYVLLGFWNPDNPGWDLYGVTHWRPLPEPPREEQK